jgi:hypothetical protein
MSRSNSLSTGLQDVQLRIRAPPYDLAVRSSDRQLDDPGRPDAFPPRCKRLRQDVRSGSLVASEATGAWACRPADRETPMGSGIGEMRGRDEALRSSRTR